MKKKAILLCWLFIIVLIVGCQAPISSDGGSGVTNNDARFDIVHISNTVTRIIDRELGNVCYSRYDGGIYCLEYKE